ncbi:REP-associated tyrosine transposase [Blastopirellula retiformator]|uniref:Transposase IS200 like protein n=1 Tax=Blastopirellula retiformator TaxID=2527970 RepID=A0A5C5V830_9BACT|nr:transposase [Blastopirellula retiformator]TWT34716.1 Transposase IS200 like protein [Blastopirellula retiformator]
MAPPKKKQVKHIHEAGHLHELTFSCYQRKPLLTNDTWRGMLAQSIQNAVERHEFHLTAFVFMPEHVHLLVLPQQSASTISSFLNAVKRPFSYRIKQHLIECNSPLLKRLTVQQRPGVQTFRFWQEGPGYDRKIFDPATIQLVIDYIHDNPVKRGLCKRAIDWKWSSARRFLLPESPIEADLPLLSPLPADWNVRGC